MVDSPAAISDSDSSNSATGTSRSLIERLRADDGAAWDRLVSLYAPLVARWCRSRRIPETDIADVFQEVFRAVAKHIAAFRNDRSHDTFRGWLHTIALSKINDYFRRQGREPRAIGGSEAQARWTHLPDPVSNEGSASIANDTSSSDAASRDEALSQRSLFRRGLEMIRGEFEPRTWQAFWLTAVEGLSAAEAAERLGMTPGAVRVAKSRLLHRLREELGDLRQ